MLMSFLSGRKEAWSGSVAQPTRNRASVCCGVCMVIRRLCCLPPKSLLVCVCARKPLLHPLLHSCIHTGYVQAVYIIYICCVVKIPFSQGTSSAQVIMLLYLYMGIYMYVYIVVSEH